MKKKTAILVDAEWFRKVLRSALPSSTLLAHLLDPITADVFYRNACLALLSEEEELFRLFCYDCEPFANPQRNPIGGSLVKFGSASPMYRERMQFFKELAALPYVALRRGTVKGRGWEIRKQAASRIFTTPNEPATLSASDINYALEQKGVDMRIGMDFATLSLKRLVERIILISGDTDMVPAIKLARREGIQVCLVQVGTQGRLAPALIEDADLVRQITPVI